MLWRLAWRSLANRRMTALLTVLAVAASVALLLGVEKVRSGARDSFADTISGTDLIVGARAGDVQLLLYAVFRIGNATANLTWESYQDIAARPEVAWIVPISLGDSHKGFRVLGTNNDYFAHYRHRRGQPLEFAAGGPFQDLFDTVVGADVAERLGYKIGDPIVVSHGIGDVSFADHADKPFRIAGILAKTGTPVDRTVHISLEALEAIHVDWQGGARQPGPGISVDEVRRMELQPKAVTAAMIGLRSRLDSFKLQRFVNEYPEEALAAILPGVALQQLWGLVGVAETALGAVARHGRGDGPAGHGDHGAGDLERAAARDGDPALGRRHTLAHHGAAAGRGGIAGDGRGGAWRDRDLWCACPAAAADR